MSNRHYSPSIWQQFVIAATLLLCSGSLYAAFGQFLPGETGSGYRPDNPQTYAKRMASNRSSSRSKQTTNNPQQPLPSTSADDKQQAIEQAIAEGNTARDKNDYEHALDHYRKAETLNPKEARALYGMGNLYADLFCYDSAIEAYRNALDLKKDYLEALIGLGYAYISKDRYDEAEKQFEAAARLKPNNVEANLGLGRIYAKKGKYEEAVKQINVVLNDKTIENKDRATAYYTLGLVWEEQNKWEDAPAEYEKAIRLNPDFAMAYLKLGAAQTLVANTKFSSLTLQEVRAQDAENLSAGARQAAENIRRAIEHGFKHPIAYLFLGNALMYQSNYQGAAKQFNDYLAKVKEIENRLSAISENITAKCDSGFSRLYAHGYWYLGFMYERESFLETNKQTKIDLLNEAIKQFEQAIKVEQSYAAAYSSLGAIYFMQENYEESIKQYKKELNYETKDSAKAGAYGGIGLAYYKIGPDSEAIYNLKKAIELRPDDPGFYMLLSTVYQKQGDFDEAIVLLKKSMEHEPKPTAHSYYFLASLYYRRALKKGDEGDFVEAIRLSQKALEINSAFPSVYLLLGQIYKFYKAGAMVDESIASYEKAAEYDPKDPAIYFQMADLYFAVKRNDEAAIKYLKDAINLKPDYAEAYRYLGLVYLRKKDDAEAVKQLLNAIKYAPKYLQAYYDLASIYKSQKNYPDAVKYLLTATELAPTEFYPYKELAKIYEEQGNNRDAISYYEAAINRLKADDTSAKNLYLGRIARLKGQYVEAVEYFGKVNLPEEPTLAYFEIGVTYVVSKNKRAAQEQYQKLVQLKSPLAEELLKKINEMK